jgi:hypothetical protein
MALLTRRRARIWMCSSVAPERLKFHRRAHGSEAAMGQEQSPQDLLCHAGGLRRSLAAAAG